MRIFTPSWTQSWTRGDNILSGLYAAAAWLGLLWLFHVPLEIGAIATFGLCVYLGLLSFYR